jgi:hypothetical protein
MGMTASRQAGCSGCEPLADSSGGAELVASVEQLQAQLRSVLGRYEDKCKTYAVEPNRGVVAMLQSFPHGARLQVLFCPTSNRFRGHDPLILKFLGTGSGLAPSADS